MFAGRQIVGLNVAAPVHAWPRWFRKESRGFPPASEKIKSRTLVEIRGRGGGGGLTSHTVSSLDHYTPWAQQDVYRVHSSQHDEFLFKVYSLFKNKMPVNNLAIFWSTSDCDKIITFYQTFLTVSYLIPTKCSTDFRFCTVKKTFWKCVCWLVR